MFFTIYNNKIIDKIAWVLAIDTINIITSTISWNWKHSFESLRSLEETSLHLPKGLAKHPHLLSMGGGNHLPSGDQLTCLSTCIIKEGLHNWQVQTELELNWIIKHFILKWCASVFSFWTVHCLSSCPVITESKLTDLLHYPNRWHWQTNLNPLNLGWRARGGVDVNLLLVLLRCGQTRPSSHGLHVCHRTSLNNRVALVSSSNLLWSSGRTQICLCGVRFVTRTLLKIYLTLHGTSLMALQSKSYIQIRSELQSDGRNISK